nr:transporter substrate-binding domain-containing protein [Vibrio sp. 99-70-13A1]
MDSEDTKIELTEQESQWLNDNPVIKVAHDQDWKPFSFTHNGESKGFFVEYARLLADLLDVEFEFVSGPWHQVYNQATNNEVDLILDLIKTPEREQNTFLYTPPYARNPNAIVTKKSATYTDLNSLKGKTVSFVEGSFLAEVLKGYDVTMSPRPDSLQAFKALQFGEVDAVLSRVVIARQVINENALYDLEIKSELDTGNSELDNMNIGVPKQKPLLQSILVKAMQRIDMNDVDELRQNILAIDIAESVRLNRDEIASVMKKPTLTVSAINDNDQFVSNELRFDVHKAVLEAIGQKVGVAFEYHNDGMLNGGFESFSNDNLDIIIGNSDFFDKEKDYSIKKPIFTSYYAVAMRHTSDPITSLSHLSSERIIGVVGSNRYIAELNSLYPDVFFGKVMDEQTGLEEVRNGSLDGLISDGLNLEHFIHKNEWVDLDIALVTSKKIQYLMAFNNHVDKGVISALNKAQKRLSEDEYTAIYEENYTLAVTPNEGTVKQKELFSDSPINTSLILKVAVGIVVVIAGLFLFPLLLNRYLSNNTISNLYTNKLMLIASAFIVAVLSIVSVAAYVVIEKVEQQTRHNIQISLSGITEALNTSIDIWIDGRASYINSIANDPILHPMVDELLLVEPTKEEIKFSTVLIDLRVYFASQQALHGDRGFFIISKDRINIASMRDSNLGEVNVIQQQRPELLDRVFLGETVLITPIASDLSDGGEDVDATMFIAAPIFDGVGEVIAAMTIRYDPAFEFSQIFSSGSVGQSGESYAFDKNGMFLSRSRFEETLKNANLLGRDANAILNMQLLKPKVAVSGATPADKFLSDDERFTKAFVGAIRDTKGSSGEGYLDYRGIPVLGSWVWRENDQFGFVTEIDEKEALKGYIFTRNLIVSLLSFTVFLTIGLTGLSLWLGRRTQTVLMKSNEELEQSVRERTLSLTSIIETAIDGIIVLDEDGDIVEFSPAAERIFGYLKSEVIHENINMLMKPINMDDDTYIEPSVCKDLEYLAKCKDGSVIAIEISAAAATIDDMAFYTCMVRDITQRKATQDALEQAKNAAEEATKSKSDFLANMSHEIRTPMNAIIGMSYLALQTELTRKQGDYLNKILNASNSLLGVINDILDFSKIEAGKLDLEVIPFSIDGVMDNISNIVTVKSREKNLEFLIAIDPEVPPVLLGDPLRIGQVLLNLANNAVKFTKAGEVVVKVELIAPQGLVDSKGNTAQLRFMVQDSGIGMTDEQMQRLFTAFSQADSSVTRQYGGTGLGLTISKNLVELMNGEIGCESTEGVGSTFFFTVDLPVDQNAHAKLPRLSNDYQGLKTLIVDDSEESRDILISMTQSMGLRAEAVSSGMLALVELTESDGNGQPYDLVIMDYKMPHMSGIDTIESLRKLKLSISPKVITVTAYAEDEVREQAQKLHLDGFLAKPVSSSSLFDSISDAFDDRTTNSSIAINTTNLMDVDIAEGVRGADILLVEDNEVNQQVATELLELAQFNVTIANNGEEAVEAVQNNSFDVVLMDIQMPVMDGYLATEKIRNELQMTDLPIIAMTANAMASDKEKCLNAGMNDHVAKPIDPNALFHVLNQWITPKDRELPELIGMEESELSETEVELPTLEGFDVESAVARMGGRLKSYNKALSMVSETLLASVEETKHALASDDIAQAGLVTHTLKGVSGNIGCAALFDATKDLESVLLDREPQQEAHLEDTHASSVVNHPDIGDLFNCVEKAAIQAAQVITDYLNRLSQESSYTEGAEGNQQNIDRAQVQNLMQQLAVEMNEYDMNAGETCEVLVELLTGTEVSEDVMKLDGYVSGYEFDEALELLKSIESKLLASESTMD